MKELDSIHRGVSDDGMILGIEFLGGTSLCLTREQALALREVLDEQLPNMAVEVLALG